MIRKENPNGAYTLARFRFTGRNLLVVVAISAMAFPSLGGGAATLLRNFAA